MWTFLFDLDGTILDTTDLIVQSFVHAFEAGLGQQVGHDELMVHFGRPLQEQFRIMRPELPPQEIDRLVNIYIEHNHAQHDLRIDVVPGADVGLKSLKEQGFRLGIVTSKRQELTVRGLSLFQLEGLFDVVVHMDSTKHHKPHPEPVEHAMTLLGAEPGRTAYVGDSPYDMASGKAAGVRTLGLVHNTFSEAVLREAGAEDVVFGWAAIVETLTRWVAGYEKNRII